MLSYFLVGKILIFPILDEIVFLDGSKADAVVFQSQFHLRVTITSYKWRRAFAIAGKFSLVGSAGTKAVLLYNQTMLEKNKRSDNELFHWFLFS